MDPFSLVALATAAGFVFKKMTGRGEDTENTSLFSSRRSTITPGKLQKTRTGIDIDDIEELPDYTFIKQLIDASYPAIFVTGGAGTGKSTFINWLMHHYNGSVLLAAPTVIAANNIDGKTLHSLFHLPLQWITQKHIQAVPSRVDIRKARLLIIDEISMVNANLLDGASAFLRKNRKVDKPFGGLPVVMVGDLFQLPPVVKPGVSVLFERYYGGQTKFYAARSLTESQMAYYAVEFNQTFRQSDKIFVDVLADIREGHNLKEALDIINSSCIITNKPPKGAVWLAPRRQEVDRANRAAMLRLPGRTYRFDGIAEKDYQTNNANLPSPLSLYLKIGAQVMFTQNDPEKKWVNGSVGIIKSIIDNDIYVELLSTSKVVKVNRSIWSNYKYRWNEKEKVIEKQVVGSYSQYPLILAWAVTIHKSQGKTLEKVHLDMGKGAFAFGQTYVALSRCQELSGLTLSRKLTTNDIKVDKDSQNFNNHLHELMKKLPREKFLAAMTPEQTSR